MTFKRQESKSYLSIICILYEEYGMVHINYKIWDLTIIVEFDWCYLLVANEFKGIGEYSIDIISTNWLKKTKDYILNYGK